MHYSFTRCNLIKNQIYILRFKLIYIISNIVSYKAWLASGNMRDTKRYKEDIRRSVSEQCTLCCGCVTL